MYTQEDHERVGSQLRKRWLVTALPSGLLLALGIVIFIVSQSQRSDTGWIITFALTLLGGFYFLFLYGVYLRPVILYARHLQEIQRGLSRETTGYLIEVSEETVDKDGLDWYALTVNVGEKGDPEDERLLYYDALKGRPIIPLGTRVMVTSNDKFISNIHEG